MEYYVELNKPEEHRNAAQIEFAYKSKAGHTIKGKYYTGWSDVQMALELFGCELEDHPEIEPDLAYPFTLTLSKPCPS